jgi:hypothetical protein
VGLDQIGNSDQKKRNPKWRPVMKKFKNKISDFGFLFSRPLIFIIFFLRDDYACLRD